MIDSVRPPLHWLTDEELAGFDRALVAEVAGALANLEWEDGYDRDSSHAEGRYVAYAQGLKSRLHDSEVEVYSVMLAIEALKTLKKLNALGSEVAHD